MFNAFIGDGSLRGCVYTVYCASTDVCTADEYYYTYIHMCAFYHNMYSSIIWFGNNTHYNQVS